MQPRDRGAPAAADLSARLGDEWAVSVAACPLDDRSLTAGERRLHDRLPAYGDRRREWLTGRQALRSLLRQLDRDRDTSTLHMPHPELALTHAAGLAVAAAARTPVPCGTGVDLEPVRPVHPDMARFFLTAGERDALDATAPAGDGGAVLRLWTVKEAVFKADLGNRGRLLADYVVEEPCSQQGAAWRAADPRIRFDYRTIRTARHWVSFASRVGDDDDS